MPARDCSGAQLSPPSIPISRPPMPSNLSSSPLSTTPPTPALPRHPLLQTTIPALVPKKPIKFVKPYDQRDMSSGKPLQPAVLRLKLDSTATAGGTQKKVRARGGQQGKGMRKEHTKTVVEKIATPGIKTGGDGSSAGMVPPPLAGDQSLMQKGVGPGSPRPGQKQQKERQRKKAKQDNLPTESITVNHVLRASIENGKAEPPTVETAARFGMKSCAVGSPANSGKEDAMDVIRKGIRNKNVRVMRGAEDNTALTGLHMGLPEMKRPNRLELPLEVANPKWIPIPMSHFGNKRGPEVVKPTRVNTTDAPADSPGAPSNSILQSFTSFDRTYQKLDASYDLLKRIQERLMKQMDDGAPMPTFPPTPETNMWELDEAHRILSGDNWEYGVGHALDGQSLLPPTRIDSHDLSNMTVAQIEKMTWEQAEREFGLQSWNFEFLSKSSEPSSRAINEFLSNSSNAWPFPESREVVICVAPKENQRLENEGSLNNTPSFLGEFGNDKRRIPSSDLPYSPIRPPKKRPGRNIKQAPETKAQALSGQEVDSIYHSLGDDGSIFWIEEQAYSTRGVFSDYTILDKTPSITSDDRTQDSPAKRRKSCSGDEKVKKRAKTKGVACEKGDSTSETLVVGCAESRISLGSDPSIGDVLHAETPKIIEADLQTQRWAEILQSISETGFDGSALQLDEKPEFSYHDFFGVAGFEGFQVSRTDKIIQNVPENVDKEENSLVGEIPEEGVEQENYDQYIETLVTHKHFQIFEDPSNPANDAHELASRAPAGMICEDRGVLTEISSTTSPLNRPKRVRKVRPASKPTAAPVDTAGACTHLGEEDAYEHSGTGWEVGLDD